MKKPPSTETGYARPVIVLSVSRSDADHAALYNILQETNPNPDTNCRWMVQSASGLASAAEVLSEREIPIVVSDENLFPGTWQTVLQHISLLADPPILIVASRLADERLWAEALNLGAWDVLVKPFDTQEVIRVVTSAWRHWEDRRVIRTKDKAAVIGT